MEIWLAAESLMIGTLDMVIISNNEVRRGLFKLYFM